jgi:putative peptidoglycan lipid II flippase
MVSNMVFNAIFAWFYGFVGLAAATALSAFINMALLYNGLHQQGVYKLSRKTVLFFARLIVAGGAMVAAILWQLEDMSVWLGWSFHNRALMLAALIALGAIVYLLTALILGLRLKDLKAATE